MRLPQSEIEKDAADMTRHLATLCECGHTLDDHDFPMAECFECGCRSFHQRKASN